MVGDWVIVKGVPTKIHDIDEMDGINREWIAGCEDGGCICYEDIHPILLTPEILYKNGFEKEGVIELYNLYAGIDHRVTIHDDKEYMNSNNEWYVHVDSEDFCSIAKCELTYVHELQHLLSLCKIDKEIII